MQYQRGNCFTPLYSKKEKILDLPTVAKNKHKQKDQEVCKRKNTQTTKFVNTRTLH